MYKAIENFEYNVIEHNEYCVLIKYINVIWL